MVGGGHLIGRAEQIVFLLETLEAYLPQIRTSTGQIVSRSSLPGPAPSSRQECARCRGTGRQGHSVCPACSGRGSVAVDAYTGETVGHDDHVVRAMTARELDLALERAATGGGHWIDRKASLHRRGSYRAVAAALARIDPRARRILVQVFVDPQPNSWEVVDVRRALDDLDRALPGRLHADMAPEAARKRSLWYGKTPAATRQRQARNMEIREARGKGVPVRAICERFNLSRSQVYEIMSGPHTSGNPATIPD